MKRINVDYFLRDSSRFPWGIFEIEYPGVGPLICYMCRAGRAFCGAGERRYMDLMTYSELERFAADPNAKTIQSIYTFVTAIGDPDTRQGKADALVEWLKQRQEFRALLQQRLDTLYRNGVISVVDGALFER